MKIYWINSLLLILMGWVGSFSQNECDTAYSRAPLNENPIWDLYPTYPDYGLKGSFPAQSGPITFHHQVSYDMSTWSTMFNRTNQQMYLHTLNAFSSLGPNSLLDIVSCNSSLSDSIPIYTPVVGDQYWLFKTGEIRFSNHLSLNVDLNHYLSLPYVPCNIGLLTNTIDCNVRLQFYARPYFVNNYITFSQNQCVNFTDIGVVDSLKIFPILLLPGGFIDRDTLSAQTIVGSSLSDTSQWNKYDFTFNISSNGSPISIPSFEIYAYYNRSHVNNNYLHGYDYMNIMDSLDQEGYDYDGFFSIHYLFDSISLTMPDAPDTMNLCLPSDTSFCASDSIMLSVPDSSFTHFLWSNGDTTSSTIITEPGDYNLTVAYECATICKDITIHPSPPISLFDEDSLFVCLANFPYVLSATESFSNLYWNTGDTSQSLTITETGLYIAYYPHFCGVVSDSVWVILQEPNNIDLFSFTDTTTCNQFSIAVADTFQSYLWSNGSTSNEAIFTESGTISLTVNDGCFDYAESFHVTIENLNTGHFSEHRHYCPQDFPITLSVSSFYQPIWNTGEQSSSITLNSPQSGTFIHASENSCGMRSDTFHIHLQTDTLTQLPQINIEEQCVEQGLYYIITEVFDENFNYQWDGQTSLNFSTAGGSTEILTISNECATFSIDTTLNACPERIVFALPTAFSPNSDGVNDQFGLLYLRDDYVLVNLNIYNRWGELVFVSENIQNKWNGFYKDKPAPIGVYIYQLLIVSNGGEDELHSGNVTLVR